MRTGRYFLALWFLLAPVLLARSIKGQTARVRATGETVLKITLNGAVVKVTFETHQIDLPKGFHVDPYNQRTSCTGSRVPCSIVDSMRIEANGKKVFVSRSAFCDLSDITTASLSVRRNDFALKIVGGDGAESYVATIRFNAESVTQRTVASGIAPNSPTQITIYHWLPLIN